MTDGRTHHADCWQTHHDCALAYIEALETELTRHEVTCGWKRAENGDETDYRRLHRSLEELVERACAPGLTAKQRGERLAVAWRNWLSGGGFGIFTRLRFADDIRRVVEAATGKKKQPS